MAITSKAMKRSHTEHRSRAVDEIIREHTLYHNGCTTLPDPFAWVLEGNSRSECGITPADKSCFTKAAQAFKVPTDIQIQAAMPKDGSKRGNHAYLAAGRHLLHTSMRRIATHLQRRQYDPNISLACRDRGAEGDRPIHTLKDLSHCEIHLDEQHARPGGTPIVTLFDHLQYISELSKWSGSDMMIVTGYYPTLVGQTKESCWYADSAQTFTEIIGGIDGSAPTSAIFKGQIPWDFTAHDVVYVENELRSAFTIYKVVQHPCPALAKQAVFLCAAQTVNLPFHIVDMLTLWTKGHSLTSAGFGTPGPCQNVMLIPADPAKPYTRDILVMAHGTPAVPQLSMKYLHATGLNCSVTMPSEVHDFLKSLTNTNGRGLTQHEAIKRLQHFAGMAERDAPGAAAYLDMLRTIAWWGPLPNVVYYVTKHDNEELPADEAPTAVALQAGPLISDESQPSVIAKNDAGTETYVEVKLVGKRNTTVPTKDWVRISDFVLDYFVEGVALETGIKDNTVSLIDPAIIEANRTTAAQRARFQTDALGPSTEEEARIEMKVEVAHKTGPCSRGINNPPHGVSVLSGVLGKTLELVFKLCAWYNPGMTPLRLSEVVTDCWDLSFIMERDYGAGGITSSDYEGADERHCEHSNRILPRFIKKFLVEQDIPEASKIYDECFNMLLRATKKLMPSLWKNCSGTGITTVVNTVPFAERALETKIVALIFAFCESWGPDYCRSKGLPVLVADEYILDTRDRSRDVPFPNITFKQFRNCVCMIQSAGVVQAALGCPKDTKILLVLYKLIGPGFGDDKLDPGTPFVNKRQDECAMRYVDRMDGFVRTYEVSSALKEEPVEYLSRIYPNPTRTGSSFCKIGKALAKLSVCASRDVDKYALKLRGYWQNDKHTPLVGAWIQAVANMYSIELKDVNEDELTALHEHDREMYWKLYNGAFPYDENAEDVQYECVAADYGMTAAELMEFDNGLRAETTWMGIQAWMLPTKLSKESDTDPLGLHTLSADPPNLTRANAFHAQRHGLGSRLIDQVESSGKSNGQHPLGFAGPSSMNSERGRQAVCALAGFSGATRAKAATVARTVDGQDKAEPPDSTTTAVE